MTYIYRLAGENLDLAEAELEGFLRSQNIEEKVERTNRIASTKKHPDFLKRLALVHEVSELIHRGKNLETDYRPEGSFKVKAYAIGETDKERVEEKFGEELSNEENTVDLENPDEIINIYILEDEYIVGKQVLEIDRGLFKQRKNQNRPFSSPISLDPVLARVLVNLSETPVNGSIFDPFCGTGGILIEAGLCGIKPFGADIQEEMVEGTRENLEEYGILNHDIRRAEISEVAEIFDQKFDAVITDLPYGQSSKKEGDPTQDFLENAEKLTDGKTVFMSNKEEINGLKPDFEIYIHKNLTRYIYTKR